MDSAGSPALLLAEMRRRGIEPGVEQPVTVDAGVIDAGPEDPGTPEN